MYVCVYVCLYVCVCVCVCVCVEPKFSCECVCWAWAFVEQKSMLGIFLGLSLLNFIEVVPLTESGVY